VPISKLYLIYTVNDYVYYIYTLNLHEHLKSLPVGSFTYYYMIERIVFGKPNQTIHGYIMYFNVRDQRDDVFPLRIVCMIHCLSIYHIQFQSNTLIYS